MKIVVLGLLVAIIISLGSGLFFLTKERDDPTKLLRSLQVRIALSIVLIGVLALSWIFGWIPAASP